MGRRMTIDSVPLNDVVTRSARRSCAAPLTVLTGAILMAAVGHGHLHRDPVLPASFAQSDPRVAAAEPVAEPPRGEAEAAPSDSASALAAPPYESPAGQAWRDATGGPLSRWAWTPEGPAVAAPEAAPQAEADIADPPRTAMMVPVPMPRPPEFRTPNAAALARRAARRMARRVVPPAQPAAPVADEPSFLEKLFGIERGPALAYTALESKPIDVAPQRRISPPLPLAREPGATAGIAVYNITARTVTLPSGERLEAHSGLGEGLDDPRLVNVRMRGPTPPGTYDLTEREALFHGVRAIRLTPVGGNDAVYGRVGLLAHTYMLGPRGDSNGCVSFRDYDRFLQAFLRGEVQRLVVVSGTQDPPPAFADGGRTQLARNGG
jgi:hypothetical protein